MVVFCSLRVYLAGIMLCLAAHSLFTWKVYMESRLIGCLQDSVWVIFGYSFVTENFQKNFNYSCPESNKCDAHMLTTQSLLPNGIEG